MGSMSLHWAQITLAYSKADQDAAARKERVFHGPQHRGKGRKERSMKGKKDGRKGDGMGLPFKASLGRKGNGREVKDGKKGKKNQQESGRWHFFCSWEGLFTRQFGKRVRGSLPWPTSITITTAESPQFNCSDNGGDGWQRRPPRS
jgi:hypothetical protein